MAVRDLVRRIVASHAGIKEPIDRVGDGDDLYSLGMTSHAAVGVMLAIEDELGVELPEELLVRSTFRSVAAMCAAIAAVRPGADGAVP